MLVGKDQSWPFRQNDLVTEEDRPRARREKGTVAGAAGPTTHIQPSLGCERASLYLFSLVLPTYVCNLPPSRFSYPTNRQQATASILPPPPPPPRQIQGEKPFPKDARVVGKVRLRDGRGTKRRDGARSRPLFPLPFSPANGGTPREKPVRVHPRLCLLHRWYPSRNRRFLCLFPATKTLVP